MTLEGYAELSENERKRVKKEELHTLIDTQLALMKNDPNQIRNVITEAINKALDKKFEQFSSEVREDYTRLQGENNTLRKAIMEQQKSLEHLHRERVRDHIFMSGIPNELEIDGQTLNEPNTIIHNIIQKIAPEISQNDYTVSKSFDCKPNHTRHSAKIVCKKGAKELIMKSCGKLNKLQPDNPLRRVFIKHEASPLHRKESDRLYSKMKKLREENADRQYKISKGKLYENEQQIDEFNISNSIFQ